MSEQRILYEREKNRLRNIKYRVATRNRSQPVRRSCLGTDISIDFHNGNQETSTAYDIANDTQRNRTTIDLITISADAAHSVCDELIDVLEDTAPPQLDTVSIVANNPVACTLTASSMDDLDEPADYRISQICAYIRSANLNKVNTNGLLSLFNTLYPSDDLPKTATQLWKEAGIEFKYETLNFCTSCMRELSKFRDVCQCVSSNRRINSELVLFSIRNELARVVKQNIDLIHWHKCPTNQKACDVVKSNIYMSRNRRDPITLLLSTDGKPTIVTSQSSIWPVLATIVEIPPPVREYERNVVLLGLWHSPVSPTADMLLGRIVKDVKILQRDGLRVDLGQKGHRTFDLNVQLMVGDLPARAKCNQINSHNGYFACTRCLYEGIRCDTHKHTLYPWYSFRSNRPRRRTQRHIDECVQIVERSNKPIKPYGVIGRSPLAMIISIPNQSVFDYFHLCLEIHMNLILKKWASLLSKTEHQRIDQYLDTICYPHTFHRRPKNFAFYSKWKAAQLRTFLVYVALPLVVHLRNAFPAVMVTHFSLFMIYVRTLRFFDNQDEVRDMRSYICAYLEQFPDIYGKCTELFSTHALFHLWEQCLDHGALCFHSMFSSESSLHGLHKLAHGTTALGSQIAYWYAVDRGLQTDRVKYSPHIFEKKELRDDLFDKNVFCQVERQFDQLFLSAFGVNRPSSLRFSSRFEYGSSLFHSLSYQSRKSSASFTVCVENHQCRKGFCFGEIIFFFHFKNDHFFFFKELMCCARSFSSLVVTDQRVLTWRDRIDKYYHFVQKSSSRLVILSCSCLMFKSLFLPFDNELSLCTPIEYELEHD